MATINNLPFSADSGFATTANVTTGNAVVAGNVTANIVLTDNYRWANGVPVDFGGGGNGNANTNYSNANVAAYLPINTSNVSGNNFSISGNVVVGQTVTANIVGNVTTGKITYTSNSVAIGLNASANANSVSIGWNAGQISQGVGAVAIGRNAGGSSQSNTAVAIGAAAGNISQKDGAVAIGDLSGFSGQGFGAVAVGQGAGQTSQGRNAVAIGYGAGKTNQPPNSIILNASELALNATVSGTFVNPIRNDSTNTAQGVYYNTTTKELTYTTGATPYGNTNVANYIANVYTGRLGIGTEVLIGYGTGDTGFNTGLGKGVVQIGWWAGRAGSNDYAIAIGYDAANSSGTTGSGQGEGSIAIGAFSASGHIVGDQGANCIAIGRSAGSLSSYQSPGSIAIGAYSGASQRTHAIAIGKEAAGDATLGIIKAQGEEAIAVGYRAGFIDQFSNCVAIGTRAGFNGQGAKSIFDYGGAVALGWEAAYIGQKTGAIAIGFQAGYGGQGEGSIAIGAKAGISAQAANSIIINGTGVELSSNIGNSLFIKPIRSLGAAGSPEVLTYSSVTGEIMYANATAQWAVGAMAGMPAYTGKLGSANTIAVGNSAGNSGQGLGAVAIGGMAGMTNQGANAVAIGFAAGLTNQTANSIAINATGIALNPSAQGFYVAPVRSDTANVTNSVYYNTTTKELTYGPVGNVTPTAISNGTSSAAIPTANGNIVLTVAGNVTGTFTANSVYLNKIRNDDTNVANVVYYDVATKELTYGPAGNSGPVTPNAISNGTSSASIPALNGNIVFEVAGAAAGTLTASSVYLNKVRYDTANIANTVYYNAVTKELTYGPGSSPSSNAIVSGTTQVRIPSANGNIEFTIANVPYGRWSTNNIAIGANAGNNQYTLSYVSGAIAIGKEAGSLQQGADAIAIGTRAGGVDSSGQYTQRSGGIAIGSNAGWYQGPDAVSIGQSTSTHRTGSGSINIGAWARVGDTSLDTQVAGAIAIGANATAIGRGTVCIGADSWSNTFNSVLIGAAADDRVSGYDTSRLTGKVIIGAGAGQQTANNCVILGQGAGFRGLSTFFSNSIVIDATGSGRVYGQNNAFFVRPIRELAPTGLRALSYDPGSAEITYSNVAASTLLTAGDAQSTPGEIGQTIYVLPNGKPAYWDGVDNVWKYYSDDTAV